jgi:hypothetical protein
MQAGQATQDRINRARVQQLGGQPYGMMAQDFKNQLGAMDRQADQSRNNNIGALLQAYLKTSGPDPEKYGDGYESSFVHQRNLQYDPTEGIGMGDAMGKAQLDPWDKDPWGDAGF